MKKWLKRHPTVVNICLSFLAGVLAGLWGNLCVAHLAEGVPLKMWYHALLVGGVGLVTLQVLYNRRLDVIDKRHIREILALACRFLAGRARVKVPTSDIRAIIHLAQKARPGMQFAKQKCLVPQPQYWVSATPPRDRGAIPLDLDPFKRWYINVRAFHQQEILCGEPNMTERPRLDGLYINTPSLFTSCSVISTPIWDRADPPKVVGTVTFDSSRSLADLAWATDGSPMPEVIEMMTSLAELIGRILTDNHNEA